MASVLIVEDQPNVRRSMALMVEQDGHTVAEAAHALDALALLTEQRFDVVISDVRMPGELDGVSLLRRVKAIDPDIEVVLATAFGTIDHAVDAIKCGAYDYLTKPVDPERLLLTIRRAAERGALVAEPARWEGELPRHVAEPGPRGDLRLGRPSPVGQQGEVAR